MRSEKLKACDLAFELINLLDQIDDEEFVDDICVSVHCNDNYGIIEIKDKLVTGDA